MSHAYGHLVGSQVGIELPIPGLTGVYGIVAATVMEPVAGQDQNDLLVTTVDLADRVTEHVVPYMKTRHRSFIGSTTVRR